MEKKSIKIKKGIFVGVLAEIIGEAVNSWEGNNEKEIKSYSTIMWFSSLLFDHLQELEDDTLWVADEDYEINN